jgi:eukaryotic-like serine/threonine-protein kinase
VTTNSLVGQRIDEYEVLAPLGQGGMGQVYLAVDSRLGRHVALKVVDTGQIGDSSTWRRFLRRFQREAQAIAQLDHPHIVRLYRFGESHGFHYIAMQYVEGADLHTLLASYHADRSFMPLAEVSRVVREIGEALDYAHEQGVVHRDVKPANIIVNREGRAVLADFGLVLLEESGTTAGEAFGTPHYMSPEQVVSSAAADGLSDLYSLGVILYEMVTGRAPFEDANPVEVALKHVNEAPPSAIALRPEIGEPLAAVILRALAKDPQERFATCREMATALEAALPALPEPPVTAPFLSLPERASLHSERSGGLQPVAIARARPTTSPPAAAPTPFRAVVPAALLPLLLLTRPQTILLGSGCLLLAIVAMLALSAVYAISGGRWAALNAAVGGKHTIFLPLISKDGGEPSPQPAGEGESESRVTPIQIGKVARSGEGLQRVVARRVGPQRVYS